MQSPLPHEEDANNRLKRLPQSAERANGQENLAAALDVCQGVFRTVQENRRTEPEKFGEDEWVLNELIKEQEMLALYAWAGKQRLLLDADDFTQHWLAFGRVEGGEHQIYQQGGIYFKRNNLAFHISYLEYFERLFLHNWLFPDTMYWFEGLMVVIESDDEPPQLRPVVSQIALKAVRGASREEVAAEMLLLGFEPRYEDNYANADRSIFIDDLHDQNVLVDDTGDLLIFDPVIYLTGPTE